MNTPLTLLCALLFCIFQSQETQSQEKNHPHTFTISGQNRIELKDRGKEGRLVEYDTISPDHLYLTDFGAKGHMLGKTRFQFKGHKFDLQDLENHFNAGELVKDGVQKIYAGNDTLLAELIFKEDTLQQQTTYHGNGNKLMQFSGREGELKGAFLMWYPDGQLHFSGTYENDLKEGVFESFAPSGMLERKGIYKQGKLISGDPVVQDLVYEKPDMEARYKHNEFLISDYFKYKTVNLSQVKELSPIGFRKLDVFFTIDKSGQISKLKTRNDFDSIYIKLLHSVFEENFEGFEPARHEGVAVKSKLKLSFLLTRDGLQTYTSSYFAKKDTASGEAFNAEKEFIHVEQMPEFPGGEKGLMRYLSKNIKYPYGALRKGIQGKVFIDFIIAKDGSVSNVSILRGVHPLLDEEAKRVISSMTNWIGGRMDGRKVRVSYIVPINFVLE